jgi:DNA polymerase I-like protein with 3'-5' exonuclease and polymerase domains
MVAAAAINPELEKNLGFIVSMYGETSYWKEEFQGRDGKIFEMTDEDLRTYNARDCVVLHQVIEPMMHDMRHYGVDKVYERITVPMIPYLIKMTMNGISISASKMLAFKKELTEDITATKKRMRDFRNIPDEINFTDDDLRYIIFGVMPNKVKKALVEYPLYMRPEDKRKKNTGIFKTTKLLYDFANSLQAFPKVSKGGKTSGGKVSVDDKSRSKLLIAAHRRVKQLKEIKRRRPGLAEEIKGIEDLIYFVGEVNHLAEVKKLDSTYTDYPIWQDRKIHPVFDPSIANTGRLASRNPKQHWGIVA